MKHFVFSVAAALTLGLGAASAQDYPNKDIQGVIQWGAGGSTDTIMRSVTPHAEKELGAKVVLQNVTGGVGAIALNQVANAPADGYTLLMGAENPLIYKVMGLGKKDYDDFVPVSILARGTAILVAGKDAPFDDYAELIEHIKANPGKVKFGSTGPGGLASVVTAMLEAVEGDQDIIAVPFDGDGPALTALQGGAIDVMPAVLGASVEQIRAGNLKPLALIDTAANPLLPEAKPITEFNPAYAKFLPWGPFFGVFVAKDAPADAVAKLQAAYAAGAKNADFLKLMADRGYTPMGISGAEAETFLKSWQSTTAWLLQDAGLTKASPEEFGIARPAQ
ncbi:Bug family tripartite tricarboxylate transporter substrate binding protein [Paracoccus sanguinis]|uniref:Tripartite-type tricarboxylate transporter, receptor component TctC n=1 Tax=Paracoccus sanguinis TaxID=1545044 RepID=A0A1H2U3I4_9RHOB|nr:tripartite tricarboxylate transporter substrate binding protein [Paracoccus sanguinis]KGJ17654.1 tricarboxylate transport protein TctC [Paracoccus sanguinis]SDW50762.1 Tripartite-type tricarboxylate transporter, receptor component TctC [Paracoccus sanguinis]